MNFASASLYLQFAEALGVLCVPQDSPSAVAHGQPSFQHRANAVCDNLKRATLNTIKTFLPRGLKYVVSNCFHNIPLMFYIASNHYIVHKDCYIFLIVKMFITIFCYIIAMVSSTSSRWGVW